MLAISISITQLRIKFSELEIPNIFSAFRSCEKYEFLHEDLLLLRHDLAIG
jgi:hypothetical protein